MSNRSKSDAYVCIRGQIAEILSFALLGTPGRLDGANNYLFRARRRTARSGRQWYIPLKSKGELGAS